VRPKAATTPRRIGGEDGRQSLAEMAVRDLDAALQLLADRAQYITGASGAAIALRRGEHNDMLCRASAGSNSPELGALLSMEYGLSGESVRTLQIQRCDDAQNDPRVNREACRQLGIASVVVVPIVSGEQAIGVFELFSGRAYAFEERDISALQRLSGMVELTVKFAVAGQVVPLVEEKAAEDRAATPSLESNGRFTGNGTVQATAPALQNEPAPFATAPAETEAKPSSAAAPDKTAVDAAVEENVPEKVQLRELEKTAPEELAQEESAVERSKMEPAPKKPLFWSATSQAHSGAEPASRPSTAVPPMLRNLKKCQACGFPVSPGRTLCVECEEKRWRGQPLTRRNSAGIELLKPKPATIMSTASSSAASSGATFAATLAAPADPGNGSVSHPHSNSDGTGIDQSGRFLSSTMESQSWLAKNKYVVAALLIVSVVVAVIALLR
jgi:GAF domain